MFEMSDPDMAEELVWIGRWAKGGESVSVRFSLPSNKTRFRESDVQQSLEAALRRKHLPANLLDTFWTLSCLTPTKRQDLGRR